MELSQKKMKLDQLDCRIIAALLSDSQQPYIELAKRLKVSGGTIHVRMNKLKRAGIVQGSTLVLDYKRLGFDVSAYIGINLHNARDYDRVLLKLQDIPLILEAHYTTGQYNIFTKIATKSVEELHKFLLKLQAIKEVQSTQTIMILDTPIDRALVPEVEES
jgi:Lrp/AsnC family transcriptional regulator, regulator for asnA, asnC and gidA